MSAEDAPMHQGDPSLETLAGMISDLRRQLTVLQQDNEDLWDELARVHHAAPIPSDPTNTTTDSTPATTIPHTRVETKQPKMAIPDLFDGTHSDLKCFGAQCLLYMAVHSNDFPDNLT